MTIHLKGITWNHTRGYLPMLAASQRFEETHPGVAITWEKRSLQQFADQPIQKLIEEYDLLIIDHPWAGYAAKHKVLLPLNEYLSPDYIADQAANSVGVSHASYDFDGYQSALAVDAATPVASYRPDLLKKYGLSIPESWEQLITLAATGRVIVPAIPIDSLMNFYMLCVALGEEPFLSKDQVVSDATGSQALALLRELACLCPNDIFSWNPIKVYEAMSGTDDFVYCPFAYGYSNYSRAGYSRTVIHFTDLVTFRASGKLSSTLGGTGIAVSAACKHRDLAIEFAAFTASPLLQRTLYAESGGQPGHRLAWRDLEVNRRSENYFKNTLPALDRAYLRPRYDGYLFFQDHAGFPVQAYMQSGGSTRNTLERMNALYAKSLQGCAKG
jgi:multiple sugar transport system substrate-binding protein